MMLNIRWRFGEFPELRMTEKRELWQDYFRTNDRYYYPREIKPKYQRKFDSKTKYQIHGKWITQKRLDSSAYLVSESWDNLQLPDKYKPFH